MRLCDVISNRIVNFFAFLFQEKKTELFYIKNINNILTAKIYNKSRKSLNLYLKEETMNKFLILGVALGAVFMLEATQPAEAIVTQAVAPGIQQTHIVQAQFYEHRHHRHHRRYYVDPYDDGYRDDYRYERGRERVCLGGLCFSN